MMRITSKNKLTRNTSSPSGYGAKPVMLAGPKSTKSANNTVKRTGGAQKSKKK
jgi:hypothetical protein